MLLPNLKTCGIPREWDEGQRSEITAWSRRSRALASCIRFEKSAACPSFSLHQGPGFRLGERRAIHVRRHKSGRNPCASSLKESNEKKLEIHYESRNSARIAGGESFVLELRSPNAGAVLHCCAPSDVEPRSAAA
ncbi:uncharacterized [Tachysurus ichikawai]